MKYNDFFSLINIKPEQTKAAKYFLNHRGIEENIIVANYLKSFTKRKPTYEEVATAFRYDKRIRRVLYKYIGYIEETARSFISNKHKHLSDLPKNAYDNSRELFIKYKLNVSTFKVLSDNLFSDCMSTISALPVEEIRIVFPKLKNQISRRIWALVTLRNQIGHNKFLLNNKQLNSIVSSDKSLKANIINLYNFLPSKVKNGLIRDINECAKERDNKYDFQVKWVLISQIKIILN